MNIPTPKRVSGASTPHRSGYVTPTLQNIDPKKRELIHGYSIVPKNMWDMLTIGTHIRYLKNDGNLMLGGYINNIQKVEGILNAFELCTERNVNNPNAKLYICLLADVNQIYKRPPDEYYIEHILRTMQIKDIMNKLGGDGPSNNDNAKVNALEEEIKSLKKQIVTLTNRLDKLSATKH
jgi:hypothetical protein